MKKNNYSFLKKNILIIFLLLNCIFYSCQQQDTATKQDGIKTEVTRATKPLFNKKTAAHTGIQFQNTIQEDLKNVYNVLGFQYLYNGGGVGIADFNNDGLQDIYLTGNRVPDQLYLNKGNFKFENISKKAGISDKPDSWSNGVSFVDINGDGWLDIYVCKGGPERDPNRRKNEFYINQGNLTFREEAQKYGLADQNISTQAAFLDFDKDGDMDCFVMNNAVFGAADMQGNDKKIADDPTFLTKNSPHLYENQGGGNFQNISKKAGVEAFSYGLGLLVQDFNGDDYPDIYVANDYYIPDFMFINNQNGTFTNQIKERTQQNCFYGMGADAADINNDGWIDIGVLDMSSDDHIRNKTLMPSMNVNLFYTLVAKYQFQHQYMFNTLQLNDGTGHYSNIAHFAGLANSDWSWSILLADFDLDGYKDCYITNGIKRYLNDNDFKRRMDKMGAEIRAGKLVPTSERIALYESMPSLKITNNAFQNNTDLTFSDQSKAWNLADDFNSNGAAYVDLDNDGDLDLVTNNLDQMASIYENTASQSNHYLTIDLPYNSFNAKVKIFNENKVQIIDYHPVRGYQSSQDARLNFGLKATKKIDSIHIYWPDNTFTKKENVATNQILSIKKTKGLAAKASAKAASKSLFEAIESSSLGIDFIRRENKYNDYKKEALLPYLQSTLGPKISTGDVNKDGLADFYIGGATDFAGALFVQNKNGTFQEIQGDWQADKAAEDLGSTFFDADGDGDLDLYVCSGGNESAANAPTLADRLYLNQGNNRFTKSTNLPDIRTVTAAVCAADVDGDGDVDLFVGGRQQPQKYPLAEKSYLLINEKGAFKLDDNKHLKNKELGMVNDAKWADIDQDGDMDLLVASEWAAFHVLENKNGTLQVVDNQWNTDNYKGWWQSINVGDLDGDGDLDLVVGNLGLNTKFEASMDKPFKLYAGDFDQNGTHDLVLSKKYKNDYVPVRGFQCSSEQMPILQNRFDTYQGFANASIEEVLDLERAADTQIFETNTFASAIFINENGTFKYQALPTEAQFSPTMSSLIEDVDRDGKLDIITVGNLYNMEPETPRLDALSGKILRNKGQNTFEVLSAESTFSLKGDFKTSAKVGEWYLFGKNTGAIDIYKKK